MRCSGCLELLSAMSKRNLKIKSVQARHQEEIINLQLVCRLTRFHIQSQAQCQSPSTRTSCYPFVPLVSEGKYSRVHMRSPLLLNCGFVMLKVPLPGRIKWPRPEMPATMSLAMVARPRSFIVFATSFFAPSGADCVPQSEELVWNTGAGVCSFISLVDRPPGTSPFLGSADVAEISAI